MLSKNNKILIGCLALLLVMSVGYALFSDTITINGSATAKGDFEITTEAIDLNEEDYSTIIPFSPITVGIVEKPTISVSNNVVTTNVELGSPGSFHTFGIKVKNTGTIPAKLKSVEDITNGNFLFGTDDANRETGTCVGELNKNQICATLYWDSGWLTDYEDDVTLRWPDFAWDEGMLDAVLDPGEETYYIIVYSWPDKSTEQGEPLNLNWQIKINWQQVTE